MDSVFMGFMGINFNSSNSINIMENEKMSDYWVFLKPIMIVVAIFAIVYLLLNLPSVLPDVDWASINNSAILPLLPWFIMLALTVCTIIYILGRRD